MGNYIVGSIQKYIVRFVVGSIPALPYYQSLASIYTLLTLSGLALTASREWCKDDLTNHRPSQIGST